MIEPAQKPLAERMRPKTIEEYIGQEHLLSGDAVLQRAIESGHIPSMILWGPPGVGKTTLARLIAHTLGYQFYSLSAISSGVKELRAIIESAEQARNDISSAGRSILFIDEIHRFNKAQQDALLGAVEQGIVTLIGATTENPSFEVIPALLSRCQVYVLKPLDSKELLSILHHALKADPILKEKKIEVAETEALLHFAGGDARKLLNTVELVVSQAGRKQPVINNENVTRALQRKAALYDKSGEQHYDIISAFIKSMRGSDPNAAVYYLARMLEGGEDPKFIARRMLIFSSEDIGNANPNALLLANTCFNAINVIGMPEARIILSQAAVYLASSVKSNASYMAVEEALDMVRKTGDLPIPLHIRNAPTKLMKDLDYGKGYKYAHDFEGNFVKQEFLPEKIAGTKFYEPGQNAREEELRRYLKSRWGEKYEY